MRARHPQRPAGGNGRNPRHRPFRLSARRAPPELNRRTILLISEDTAFSGNLRRAANIVGLMIVRVDGVADVRQFLYVMKPAAVLLDLGLPLNAALEKAEAVLGQADHPPLVLLRARRGPLDPRWAGCAGSVLDKSADPTGLIEAVNRTVAVSHPAQTGRNTTRWILDQWLRPCVWLGPLTSRHGFWAGR